MALTNVPPVVGSREAFVDLFPGALTDVVDKETRGSGVRVKRDPKRISQAAGKGFLTPVAGRRDAGNIAAAAVRALEWVCCRYRTVTSNPEDLAKHHVPVAGCVVRSRTSGIACVITAAVSDTYVQKTVLAKVQITTVVIPGV